VQTEKNKNKNKPQKTRKAPTNQTGTKISFTSLVHHPELKIMDPYYKIYEF
jgi:hypothetical protein